MLVGLVVAAMGSLGAPLVPTVAANDRVSFVAARSALTSNLLSGGSALAGLLLQAASSAGGGALTSSGFATAAPVGAAALTLTVLVAVALLARTRRNLRASADAGLIPTIDQCWGHVTANRIKKDT